MTTGSESVRAWSAPPAPRPHRYASEPQVGHDRVRGDEQVAVDDVRQGRGQAGQQEPVDREGGEDQDEERQPDVVVRDEDGHEDQQAARTRLLITRVIRRGHRSRKTPTNGPSTENGRRIVANARGDGAGVGRPLRREQDRGDQRDLEDAVRELGQQSHREQPAEPPVAQQGAQVPEEGHPRRIGERRHARPGRLPGPLAGSANPSGGFVPKPRHEDAHRGNEGARLPAAGPGRQAAGAGQLLLRGPVVLFFFPAAGSGGCTREAVHFRDLASRFAEAGSTPDRDLDGRRQHHGGVRRERAAGLPLAGRRRRFGGRGLRGAPPVHHPGEAGDASSSTSTSRSSR